MQGLIASKITARSQTTLPPGVRKVLGVGPGDRVGYLIEGFEVRLVNLDEPTHTDPALAPFLELLGRDIAAHPERLNVFPRELVARIERLTTGVPIDHDASLDGAVAL
jgi:antitoxin PrlF